jgi:hypothetical protein
MRVVLQKLSEGRKPLFRELELCNYSKSLIPKLIMLLLE